MDYRPGAFSLALYADMAIPIYTAPSMEEVRTNGLMLWHHFIHQQFILEDIPEEDLVEIENPPDELEEVAPLFNLFNHQAGESSSIEASLQLIGENIRELASQYAASQKRSLIREQANEIDLSHINREEFYNLLNDIFQDGTDRYSVVALFFFCSDVLIRCAREGLRHIGSRLLSWAMQFLVENVCTFVFTQGGWDRVLSNIHKAVYQIAVIVTIGIFVACGFSWIRRNW